MNSVDSLQWSVDKSHTGPGLTGLDKTGSKVDMFSPLVSAAVNERLSERAEGSYRPSLASLTLMELSHACLKYGVTIERELFEKHEPRASREKEENFA